MLLPMIIDKILTINTSSALMAERFTEYRTPPMVFVFDLMMTKVVNSPVLLRVHSLLKLSIYHSVNVEGFTWITRK